MSMKSKLHVCLSASLLAGAALMSSLAQAEVPNPAQDAMLGDEGQGPRDRFTSAWHVDCANAGAGRRCAVTLHTADRESKNYTMQMRYPIRFVVDADGRHVEFPLEGANIPPEMRVDLILDGRPIGSLRAADRVADPALFDQLLHGRQLLVSTGSFVQGKRVRAYLMLEGLDIALADAERRVQAR